MSIQQTKKISVLGVGYIGLPILLKLADNISFELVGFDCDNSRVEELKNCIDRNNEHNIDEKTNSKIIFSSHKYDLDNSEVYIVTVPTPIDNSKRPNLKSLKGAAVEIGESIKRTFLNSKESSILEFLIIVESTLFPGATNDIFAKILLSTIPNDIQDKISIEFGYSPERLSPGRNSKAINEIVKIVSANNKKTLTWVNWLYEKCIGCKTHQTTSIEVAEAAKVLENTQRDLNIALINECVHIFSKMNISTNEVIEAASTKWNFMSIYPGLVGGHCISVDPYYLTYKAEQLGYHPEVVLAGRRINDGFARWIAKQAVLELFKLNKGQQNYRAFIYGITFKANCNDLRNSKSLELIDQLQKYGIEVYWNDPLINENKSIEIQGAKRLRNLRHERIQPELIILCVGHDEYLEMNKEEYRGFLNSAMLIYDVANILNFKHSNLISL